MNVISSHYLLDCQKQYYESNFSLSEIVFLARCIESGVINYFSPTLEKNTKIKNTL